MAIHDHLPGIEATICVDGQPLREYRTQNDEVKHRSHAVRFHQSLRTITNYVESQSDKEFTIKLALKDHYIMNCPRLLLKIFVDNLHICSFIWLRHLYNPSRGEEFVVRGPVSGATVRPMKFTALETSEWTKHPNFQKLRF
jgi:hypothetical protein